jgi:hypothetical protein
VRQGVLDLAIAGGSEAPFSLGYLKAWEALQVFVIAAFSTKRVGVTAASLFRSRD